MAQQTDPLLLLPANDKVAIVGSASFAVPAWRSVGTMPIDGYLALIAPQGGSSSCEVLELGTGPDAATVTRIARVRPGWTSSGAHAHYWLPAPIFIATGAGVWARSYVGNCSLALGYYADVPADQIAEGDPECSPGLATGIALTPNAVAWANSSWTEIESGLASAVGAFSLAFQTGPQVNIDMEWDIGVGSPPVVATTIRASRHPFGMPYIALRFPLLPIAAGEKISVRLRKSDTDTTNFTRIGISYYTPFDPFRAGTLSFLEFEVEQPTRALLSFLEFSVAVDPTRGLLSFLEMETTAATRGRLAQLELEVPTPASRGLLIWLALRVPGPGGGVTGRTTDDAHEAPAGIGRLTGTVGE